MISTPFLCLITSLCLLPGFAQAAQHQGQEPDLGAAAHPSGAGLGMYLHPGALFCVAVFVFSYLLVLTEEQTHLRKSKPVMLGAGIIWAVIAMIAPSYGVSHEVIRAAIYHGVDEYGSLFLFLLAAMTYIGALEERNVFAVLRAKMLAARLSFRAMFWVTGVLAFCLSPIADNLTTALVLGTVTMALGRDNPKFVAISCINIVNAANAGGAFSPFGDITTLMVWQSGQVEFFEFFSLFVPSVVCFIVPALMMQFAVPKSRAPAIHEDVRLKRGARVIIGLGLCTIALAVSFEQFLGLPPFLGMVTGLSILMFFAWYIRHIGNNRDKNFDILEQVAGSEWDTMLFFFGVIFSVGGLSFLGYLEIMSMAMYQDIGPGFTNIALGLISAVVDNIPVMFAVLAMEPEMSHFQWLLITLTCGVGGSLLSIGSAAGVALMGVARGRYTFSAHLRWAPAIALGFAASVATHYLLNG